MPTQSDRIATGGSLAEAVAGLLFFVPVACLIINITAAVIAQTQNDAMAKHATRQAASQPSMAQAQAAANAVVSGYTSTALCSNPTLVSCQADPTGTSITCITSITCNLPVTIPFWGGQQVFQANDTEPIVSQGVASGASTAPGTGSGGWSGNNGYLNVPITTGTTATMVVPNPSAPVLPPDL